MAGSPKAWANDMHALDPHGKHTVAGIRLQGPTYVLKAPLHIH